MIKPYYKTKLGELYLGDCLEVMKELSDKSVDFVISDPPYFRIKGNFDFQERNFSKYLKQVDLWAQELKKILLNTGTLFWFGDEKRIAYSQIILDKYFGLLNNLVWLKQNLKGGLYGSVGSNILRSFPICTERILMYSNDTYNLTECVFHIRDYIRKEIIKAKGQINLKEINKALGTAISGGGLASSCFSLNKKEPAMITKEMYEKLRVWLNKEISFIYLTKNYNELWQEYLELKQKYETKRRYFQNRLKLTEILEFDSNVFHNLKHETVKPLSLIEALLITCSKENNLILDPFLGSGTTAVACEKLNRRWIGIEISEKYCEIAKKRIKEEADQGKLFR